ncbi:heavy metal translocating P-type ATPase [Halobacterium salinarum]|uniref:heavy metal translocating P-type ATPase n=1 Tax=Halobacterium salinarum TaxID=2242 RepID=UPI002557A318|nr:heavy metal translocating P-type ATPase [Halobacterium salinarum]MDL0120960.1 heavy metal translocating P-type ATPase [Halobacterium salinarum]MDL0130951.1 heavy metal translocating P-type ATPase [Halobacterium salinarum]MDL0141557.1 heavy metal translocating P-type ATPase [Halobacterium salinarum]
MTTCTLCDLPVEDPIIDKAIDGEFCCRGCLEVARLVDNGEDVDLSITAVRDRVAAEDSQPDVPEGAETAYLSIDGMHCQTCEGFIELLAEEEDGVHEARASYATEMAQVVYDPAQIDRNAISAALSRLGYQAHGPDEENDSLRSRVEFGKYRAVLAAVLMMPVLILYVLFIYPVYLGIYPESFLYGSTVEAMVFGPLAVWSTLIVIGLGFPIFRGAYVSMKVGRPNMDVLIAIAVLAAYFYSLATYLTGGRDPYFDVAVMVLAIVTIGNHLESRVKRAALGNRADLTDSRVEEARRLADDSEATETIDIEACEPGDQLLVKPGERIPVDGQIVDGTAAIDEALITGESLPQRKSVGDDVLGGSIPTDNAVVVEVGPENTSTMDRLVELLWNVKSSATGVQHMVNRFAVLFVPFVLGLAVLTATGWFVLGNDLNTAIMVGVSVLVVSCPCSLGIATPLALAAATRDATDNRILVLNETVLERIDDSAVVVFDKTGTLTTGEMELVDVAGDDPDEVLAMAAAVERRSSHPIAAAIDDAAPPTTRSVSSFESTDRTVSALVDDTRVVIGHPDSFDADEWTIPAEIETAVTDAYESGNHPTAIAWEGVVRGVVTVRDTPRENWEHVVSELADADREIVVLTGDDEQMTETFANHPAVDHVFAGVRPESKEVIVQGLRERGMTTMIGDGTNDAPALASADLGIAVSSGTDLAIEAADAVVLDDRLDAVPEVFELASETRGRIKQNLVWAAGYNAIALPLAMTGVITPLIAAVMMAVSSLIVVFNSKRRLLPTNGDHSAEPDSSECTERLEPQARSD